MLDFHLTTEQEALKARLRAFAQEIVAAHVLKTAGSVSATAEA